MARSDVIIIGGGAIGLSSAYYLNRLGYDVTVFDSDTPDQVDSCSWGNAGMICPSHIVPLAAPGVIKQGLKWLLDPKSPFSIEFKPSLELVSWLWKFKNASNPDHVQKGANILRQLGMASRELFIKLGEEMDFGLETNGILMLCAMEETLEHELAISKMARDLDMEALDLDQEGITKVETGMATNLAGGVFYPSDCHVNPVQFLSEMKQWLKNSGVQIHHETPVCGLNVHNGKVVSALVNKTEWQANHFVLSAGSFSGKFVKSIGLKLPLMAGKGYTVTINTPPKKPALPAILVEARIASTPMGPIWRFGGTMTVTDRSRKVNERKFNAMLSAVSDYYPEYEYEWTTSLEPWVGLRPLSADGVPYIGAFAQYPNLLVGTGHAMLGVSLAPITGKLIAEVISGKEPSMGLEMLSPDRF